MYADGIHILDGSVNVIRKNMEVLQVASKQTGLEINAEKA
jgi:hypothetical protein